MGTVCVSRSHYLKQIDILEKGIVIEGSDEDAFVTVQVTPSSIPKHSAKKKAENPPKVAVEYETPSIIYFPSNDDDDSTVEFEEEGLLYGQVCSKRVSIDGSWLGHVSGTLDISTPEFRRNTQLFITVFEDSNFKFLLEQLDEKKYNKNAKIFIFKMENNGEVDLHRKLEGNELEWNSNLSLSSSIVEEIRLEKYMYPYIVVCSQTRCTEGGYKLHIESENEIIVKFPRNFCEFFGQPKDKYKLFFDGEWTEDTSGGKPTCLEFKEHPFRGKPVGRRKKKSSKLPFKKYSDKLTLDLSTLEASVSERKKSGKERRNSVTSKRQEIIEIIEEGEEEEEIEGEEKLWLRNPQIPLIAKEFTRCYITLERMGREHLTMGLIVLKPYVTEENGELENEDDEEEEYSDEEEDDEDDDSKNRENSDGTHLKKKKKDLYYKKVIIAPEDVVGKCEKMTCEKNLSFRCFLLPSDQPYIFVPFLNEPYLSGKFRLTIDSDEIIHRLKFDKVEMIHEETGFWMERTCGGRPDKPETGFFNCPQFFLKIKMAEDSPWRTDNKYIPATLIIEQETQFEEHICIGFFLLSGGYRFTKLNWDRSKIVIDKFPQYKKILTYQLKLVEGQNYTVIPYPMLDNYAYDYTFKIKIKTLLPSDTDISFVPAPENANLFIDIEDFENSELPGTWNLLTSGGIDMRDDPLIFNNPQFFVSTGSKTKVHVSMKHVTLLKNHQLRGISGRNQKRNPFIMYCYIIEVFHGKVDSRVSFLEDLNFDASSNKYYHHDDEIRIFDFIKNRNRKNFFVEQVDFENSMNTELTEVYEIIGNNKNNNKIKEEEEEEIEGENNNNNKNSSKQRLQQEIRKKSSKRGKKKLIGYETEISKNIVLPSGDFVFLCVTNTPGVQEKFSLSLKTHKKLRYFKKLPERPVFKKTFKDGFIGGKTCLNLDVSKISDFVERNPSYLLKIKNQVIDEERNQHICIKLKITSKTSVSTRIYILKEVCSNEKKEIRIIDKTISSKKKQYVLSTTLSPGEYRIVIGIEEGNEGSFDMRIHSTVCGPNIENKEEIIEDQMKYFEVTKIGDSLQKYFELDSLVNHSTHTIEFSGMVGPFKKQPKNVKFVNPKYVLEEVSEVEKQENLRLFLQVKKITERIQKVGIRLIKIDKDKFEESGVFEENNSEVFFDSELQNIPKSGIFYRRFVIPFFFSKKYGLICEFYPVEVGENGKLEVTFHTSEKIEVLEVANKQKTIDIISSWYSPIPKSSSVLSPDFGGNPVFNLLVKKGVEDEKSKYSSVCFDLFASIIYRRRLLASISKKYVPSSSSSISMKRAEEKIKERRSSSRRRSVVVSIPEKLDSDSYLSDFFPNLSNSSSSTKRSQSEFSSIRIAVYVLTPSKIPFHERIKTGLKNSDFLGNGTKTIMTPNRHILHVNLPFSEDPYSVILTGVGVDLRTPYSLQIIYRGGSVEAKETNKLGYLPSISKKFDIVQTLKGKWNIFGSGDPFNDPNVNWMNLDYVRCEVDGGCWCRVELRVNDACLMGFAIIKGKKDENNKIVWSTKFLENEIIASMNFAKGNIIIKTVFLPEGISFVLPLIKEKKLGEVTVVIRSMKKVILRKFPTRGRVTEEKKKLNEEEKQRLGDSYCIEVHKNDLKKRVWKFHSGWAFGRSGGLPHQKRFEQNPYFGIYSEKEQEIYLVIESGYFPFMKIYLCELEDPKIIKRERKFTNNFQKVYYAQKGERLDIPKGFDKKLIDLVPTDSGFICIPLKAEKLYRIIFSIVPASTNGSFGGTLLGKDDDSFHLTKIKRIVTGGDKSCEYHALLKGIWDRSTFSGVRGNLQDWGGNNPSVSFKTDSPKPTFFDISVFHNCKNFQTVSFIILDKARKLLYKPQFFPYQSKWQFSFVMDGGSSYELIPILETDGYAGTEEDEKSALSIIEDRKKSKNKKRRKTKSKTIEGYPYFVHIQSTEELRIESGFESVEEISSKTFASPNFEYMDDETWAILNNVSVVATCANATLHKRLISSSSLDALVRSQSNGSLGGSLSVESISSFEDIANCIEKKSKTTQLHDSYVEKSDTPVPLIVYGANAAVLIHGVISVRGLYEFSDTKGANEILKSEKFGSRLRICDIPMAFVAAGELGKGRVVVAGDVNLFHLDYVQKKDNRTLLLNAVEYAIQQKYNVDGNINQRRRTGFDDLQKLQQSQNPLQSPRNPKTTIVVCYSRDSSRIPLEALKRVDLQIRIISDFDVILREDFPSNLVGAMYLVFEENELISERVADFIRKQIRDHGMGAIILSKCWRKVSEIEEFVFPANYILHDSGIQISSVGTLYSNLYHEHSQLWWLPNCDEYEKVKPNRMIRSERHFQTVNYSVKQDYKEEVSHLAACTSLHYYHYLTKQFQKFPNCTDIVFQVASVIESTLYDIPITDRIMFPFLLRTFGNSKVNPSKRGTVKYYDYGNRFAIALNCNVRENYYRICGMKLPIFIESSSSWDFYEENFTNPFKKEEKKIHKIKVTFRKGIICNNFNTSIYARGGEEIIVEFPTPGELLDDYNIWVVIGPRSPNLMFAREIVLRRNPKIWSRRKVNKNGKCEVCCYYGGIIFLECEKKDSAFLDSWDNFEERLSVEIFIRGGAINPKFKLGKSIDEYWMENIRIPEKLPSPWIIWEGQKLMMIIPVSLGCLLINPSDILQFWDTCVDHLESFCSSLFPTKPILFVDCQTVLSDVHSSSVCNNLGSIVVTLNDYAFWSVIILKEKIWIVLKELAYFLHRKKGYAWKGRMNALVHISSLYVLKKVMNIEFTQKIKNYKLRMKLFVEYINANMKRRSVLENRNTSQSSNNNEEATGIGGISWQTKSAQYRRSVQLSTFFELFFLEHFGWNVYTEIFRSFSKNCHLGRGLSDLRNQEKVGRWVTQFSMQIQRNVSPYFEAMGFLVSQYSKGKISDLRKWVHKKE